MSNFRRRLMMSIKKEEKYTQLEYIEKNGFTQYINTGLIPQPEWTYEFNFERTGKFSYLCGSDISWSSGAFNISIDLSSSGGVSGKGLRTLNFGKPYVSSNLIPKINERLIIKKTPNQFIIGTNIYNIEIGDTYANYPLVIFTTNRNGTPQLSSIFIQQYRLYSFKITDENGNLIQELLPALDKNGVVGMYDTVKRKFHYNAGTGEFIAGPIALENYFDYEEFYNNYVTVSQSSVGRYAIKLEPNTSYKVSTNLSYGQSNGSSKVFAVSGSNTNWVPSTINNGVLPDKPRTITTDSQGYMCIGIYISGANIVNKSEFENGTAWVKIKKV